MRRADAGRLLTGSYGTPYLLSIGLSKEATGYVWVAGPLSGLVVQPVLGSLSDSSMSRFRRRKYMLASAVVMAGATSVIAFAGPIAESLLELSGGGLGDWDPLLRSRVDSLTIALSVAGFWVLDFAVNGLQVISRALVLDNAGPAEQNEANAWHGRMLHLGNIAGYWCGWVDLASWPALAWLGGGQFRKFAVVSIVLMLAGVGVTCYAIPEADAPERNAATASPDSAWTRIASSLAQIWCTLKTLPRAVRRVCLVQLLVRAVRGRSLTRRTRWAGSPSSSTARRTLWRSRRRTRSAAIRRRAKSAAALRCCVSPGVSTC